MTLIAMMKLDKNTLLAIADEQSSTSSTKTQDTTKLAKIYDKNSKIAIWGATGGTYPIAEMRARAEKALQNKENISIESVLDTIRESINAVKHEKLEQAMKSSFPTIEIKDIYTGKYKDKDFHADILGKLQGYVFGTEDPLNYIVGGDALIGTYSPDDGTGLYKINFKKGIVYYLPGFFDTIGSGWMGAESVLSSFANKMTKKGRQNIPHTEGVIKMLEAYNKACEFNTGVGGFPTIQYIKEGKMYTVDDNQAYLASRLTGVLSASDDPFSTDAPIEDWISQLTFQENTLDTVLAQMLQTTKEDNTIRLIKFIAGLKEY